MEERGKERRQLGYLSVLVLISLPNASKLTEDLGESNVTLRPTKVNVIVETQASQWDP